MRKRQFAVLLWAAVLTFAAAPALADSGTCSTAAEMGPAVKSALDSTAMQIFRQAQAGDYFNLQKGAIPSLASSFGGVQAAVGENKDNLLNAQAAVRLEYVLEAASSSGSGRTEFFCGAYPDLTGFALSNLPPGRYAIVTLDVKGGKTPVALSVILQDTGGWKLAGFYVRPTELGGHDGNWYINKANEYKSRGANHNAHFYYLQAWELLAPLNFMSTQQLDKVSDAVAASRPADVPAPGQTADLVANGKTYKLTQMFPTPVGDTLYLVARYQVPSVANQTAAYQDNMAIIKALAAKYPEIREAFTGVVARAVEPGGNDYGTMLAMKDVK